MDAHILPSVQSHPCVNNNINNVLLSRPAVVRTNRRQSLLVCSRRRVFLTKICIQYHHNLHHWEILHRLSTPGIVQHSRSCSILLIPVGAVLKEVGRRKPYCSQLLIWTMRIWTIAAFLCCHCSIFIAGELQSSKGTRSGGESLQTNDNNNTNKSISSFQGEIDDGNQSVVQQSSALMEEDETRKLSALQVSYLCFKSKIFFVIVIFFYFGLFFIEWMSLSWPHSYPALSKLHTHRTITSAATGTTTVIHAAWTYFWERLTTSTWMAASIGPLLLGTMWWVCSVSLKIRIGDTVISNALFLLPIP